MISYRMLSFVTNHKFGGVRSRFSLKDKNRKENRETWRHTSKTKENEKKKTLKTKKEDNIDKERKREKRDRNDILFKCMQHNLR